MARIGPPGVPGVPATARLLVVAAPGRRSLLAGDDRQDDLADHSDTQAGANDHPQICEPRRQPERVAGLYDHRQIRGARGTSNRTPRRILQVGREYDRLLSELL